MPIAHTYFRPLFRANLVYAVGMLILITAGHALQSWSLPYGLLLTEFVLILLPALLAARLEGQGSLQALGLRWPGWKISALAVVAGLTIWPLGVLLELGMYLVLGYTLPQPFDTVSADPLNLALVFFAMTVAAPLCEEMLFRGYLMGAYRRFLSPALSIVATALLFALFHMRLQGLVAILPVSFVLGYLRVRSDSIIPSMLTHAANNACAGSMVLIRLARPDLFQAASPLVFAILCGFLLCPPLAAASLWLARRVTAPPAPVERPAAPPQWAFAPLWAAALLYLALAGSELIYGRYPQLLADRQLALEPAPWQERATLKYEIRDIANQPIGTLRCEIIPQPDAVAFDCTGEQRPFEVRWLNSVYQSGGYTRRSQGRWQRGDMRLLQASFHFESDQTRWQAEAVSQADGLRVSAGDAPDGSATLPADSLLAQEWPWRLSALPFERANFSGSQVILGRPERLAAGDGPPESETVYALLRGQERLFLNGRALTAWKVKLDRASAWYDIQSPHNLVQFEDGYGVKYVLLEAE